MVRVCRLMYLETGLQYGRKHPYARYSYNSAYLKNVFLQFILRVFPKMGLFLLLSSSCVETGIGFTVGFGGHRIRCSFNSAVIHGLHQEITTSVSVATL